MMPRELLEMYMSGLYELSEKCMTRVKKYATMENLSGELKLRATNSMVEVKT
jgi:hypothetical protein